MKFDIIRDNELIAAGAHFWCSGHLCAVPVETRSPDARYCQTCYDLLNEEVKVLKLTRNYRTASWVPVVDKKTTENKVETTQKVSVAPIPHTQVLLPTNSTSNKTPARVSSRSVGRKGGRPRKEVPVDRIKELHGAGVSVKEIAKQLDLNAMMVSRRINAG